MFPEFVMTQFMTQCIPIPTFVGMFVHDVEDVRIPTQCRPIPRFVGMSLHDVAGNVDMSTQRRPIPRFVEIFLTSLNVTLGFQLNPFQLQGLSECFSTMSKVMLRL